MIIKKQLFIIILLSPLILINASRAQVKNSIYSICGIGQMIDYNYGINRLMGGTGIAFQSGLSINCVNPASYLGVPPSSFTIETGVYGIYNKSSDGNISQATGSINLSYLLANLYLTDRWALSFGILPISSIDYTVHSTDEVGGELTKYEKEYSGAGGLSQGYIGNSFKLLKGLTAGFNAAYILGNITKTEIGGGDNSYTEYTLENKQTVYGLYSDYGMQYSIERKGWLYTLGAIYGHNKTLNTVDDLNFTCNDTTIALTQDQQSDIKMPIKIGLGISMKKGNNFRIGLDYLWRNWENSSFSASAFKTRNSDRISIGLEFSPGKPQLKDFERVYCRLGANYQNSYIEIDNIRIKSFGVNAGIGIPLKRNNNLNLSVEYGEEGTLYKDLVKNKYWSFYLFFSLHEFWMGKVKL